MHTPGPTLLCILDGFGLNPRQDANAIALAKKPNFDRAAKSLPFTTLTTSGEAVGLPDGQMGNSEVGHLNLGAGRVVEQWLLRISRALKGPMLRDAAPYQNFLSNLTAAAKIHTIGLYSDGGVHSHREHFHLLLERLLVDTKNDIVVHLVTDGRDVGPNTSLLQVKEFEERFAREPRIKVGTVSGRFYAMDRDKRWERVQLAYDAIALANGHRTASASSWIETSYGKGTTDEFIEPAVVNALPFGSADAFLFWNFREDRMRQIVRTLAVQGFAEFARPAPLPPADRVLCFTGYDHAFGLPFLFAQIEIKNHLGEVLSELGLKQLRVAETEKYPHVTYFFNGGIEREYAGEDRALFPSPRDVKTYDLKPEMSAAAVTDRVVQALDEKSHDLIVVNLANCDMVGHTGNLEAAIKAVETVDGCLGRMLDALERAGGQALIVADHGNAEQMVNYETGAPHTAHTTYLVPCIAAGRTDITLRSGGALCDVAPTLLKMMKLEQPKEMSGTPLF